jgi:hypothetical protein
MAISATITLNDYGVEIKGLYIRVSNIAMNFPRDKYLILTIDEYLSAENREKGIKISTWVHSMPIEELGTDTLFTVDGIFTKVYAYVKTLDKYKAIKDC